MSTITETYETLKKERANQVALPTGFKNLDEKLRGGFLKPEIIVIGAPPGTGKSFLAGQIAMNVVRSGYRVCYVSLEITNEMILSRIIGQYVNIDPMTISHGEPTEKEEEKITKLMDRMRVFDESLTLYDEVVLFSDITNIISKGNYDMVVIDFIQNILIPGMEEYPRLNFIMTALRNLAVKHNVTMLLLSQLSNSIAYSNGKNDEFRLEYRGSGMIGTNAGLGFFLVYDNLSYKLVLTKNRRGIKNVITELLGRYPGNYFYERTTDQTIQTDVQATL